MPPSTPAVIGCFLLTLVTLPGCKGKDANATPGGADSTRASDSSGMALPVAGQEVRKGDLVLSVVTTGQVRSDAFAKLSRVNGPPGLAAGANGTRWGKDDVVFVSEQENGEPVVQRYRIVKNR